MKLVLPQSNDVLILPKVPKVNVGSTSTMLSELGCNGAFSTNVNEIDVEESV